MTRRVPFLAVPIAELLAISRVLSGRRSRRVDASPAPAGSRVVRTGDGVQLHVEVDGDEHASLTVVFVHGFTARLGEFDLQRAALRERGGVRIVLYDQRGHGRSGRGPARHATIDQLAVDLSDVLTEAAPTGRIVLLGHSLGGMTVMALARQRPELFGGRVGGVFLLDTSAGDLVNAGALGSTLQLMRRLHLLGLYLRWLRLSAPVLERFRRRGTTVGRALVKHYLFGTEDADHELVTVVQNMLEETSLSVTAAFYPTFLTHDETSSLPVLQAVPVTVLVGSDDRLTPASHSRSMAAAIGPSCELIVAPGAGHSVNITRPELVNGALRDLLDRVASAGAVGRTAS